MGGYSSTQTVLPKGYGRRCDTRGHEWRYKVNEHMTCAEYLYLDKRCLSCGEGRQGCLPMDL